MVKCPICEKEFTQVLSLHIVENHFDTAELLYKIGEEIGLNNVSSFMVNIHDYTDKKLTERWYNS